ncbi:MAG: hypothetical protein HYV26_11320 [Candidatus Hydrogenedentes bacterium]|nr:hypothetical protein [Candidatus Hydrogenedentota bacterium]
MDDVLESNGCQVWHGVIEAPWYLLLGFTWLFGGEDSGYITAVGGSLHYTPDDPGAIDRIEALPSLDGWRLVPLHTDLSPRIEETLWDGEPFFIHYCSGYFPNALPPDTRLDLIPAEFYPAEPVVVTSTSEDGVVWKPSRMMLARGTGMLFGTTNMGHFYLHDLALNGETLEGY